MAPATFGMAARRTRSSRAAMPPEAMTGTGAPAASASVASRFGTATRPVPTHVGVDHPGGAGGGRAAHQLVRQERQHLSPPVHRHPSVDGVHADQDAVRPPSARSLQGPRIERRGRPENGPPRPRAERGLESRQVAQAAPYLHGNGRHRLHHRADHLGVPGRAVKGAVQVHHVEPPGPALRPATGHGHGVIAEDRRGVGPALHQPDAAATLKVDRRDDDHACAVAPSPASRAKFASSRSPQPWLFSGWNWVP